jgi:hypothetical protein
MTEFGVNWPMNKYFFLKRLYTSAAEMASKSCGQIVTQVVTKVVRKAISIIEYHCEIN